MKKQKGITLIALIITIVVMLILVAVTLMIALGENGVVQNTRKASMETEMHAIYEQIAGAMSVNDSGTIKVKDTYDAAERILEQDGKTITPEGEPTAESTIIIFDVQGKFGTYTYTITTEKIIIGRGTNEVSITGATSYPYSLRIEPKEDIASIIVYENAEIFSGYDYSVTNLKDLMVAIFKIATGTDDDSVDYNTAVAYLENELNTTIETPQEAFALTMPLIGYEYTTVQEFASDVYEPTEKKLIVNGEEVTTGVTWDGLTAIYLISDGATYDIELVLDGETANSMTVKVSDYVADLEDLGKYFIGQNVSFITDGTQNGYTDDSETEVDESMIKAEYYYNSDIDYAAGIECNGNIYGIWMEEVDSNFVVTRVDFIE